MTNNNKPVSSLPFGMTELTTVSTRIVDALTRDLEDLSPLGITTTKIAEFTNQINTLMAMKKDQDHKASMRLMAKSKSQKLQELVAMPNKAVFKFTKFYVLSIKFSNNVRCPLLFKQ